MISLFFYRRDPVTPSYRPFLHMPFWVRRGPAGRGGRVSERAIREWPYTGAIAKVPPPND